MRPIRSLILCLLSIAPAGCSSSSSAPADLGARDSSKGDLAHRDVGSVERSIAPKDTGAGDRSSDKTADSAADTAADTLTDTITGCTAKSPDGTAINPGCDPDIQAFGPSAMASVTLGGKPVWLITRGTKLWTYGESAIPGVFAFTSSGPDFASLLRQIPPTH